MISLTTIGGAIRRASEELHALAEQQAEAVHARKHEATGFRAAINKTTEVMAVHRRSCGEDMGEFVEAWKRFKLPSASVERGMSEMTASWLRLLLAG